MSEHRHERGVGCDCPHDERAHRPDEYLDPAGKSLAEALRVSFRLLTVIMIGLLVLFLFTGVKSVEANQVAIIKVLGQARGTVGPGLAWNWPFPIGETEIVETNKRTLKIDDFWMHLSESDRLKSLDDVQPMDEGLRPGWDGAVLTGDRNLIHVNIEVVYEVADPLTYRRFVRDEYEADIPGQDSRQKVIPQDELMRSVVCNAAIRAAAEQTADRIRTENDKFLKATMEVANAVLESMRTGLSIEKVSSSSTSWPLKARPAFREAQNASSLAMKLRDDARTEAENILNEVAGSSYVALVGYPWGTRDARRVAEKGPDSEEGPYDLIGQYTRARGIGDEKKAAMLLRQIDAMLVNRRDKGGQVAKIIATALEYQNRVTQRVRARVTQFTRLLPEYRQSPQFTIQRLWEDAREAILGNPAVEKFYVSTDKGSTVLIIDRDPDIVRQIQRENIQAEKEAQEARKAKEAEEARRGAGRAGPPPGGP